MGLHQWRTRIVVATVALMLFAMAAPACMWFRDLDACADDLDCPEGQACWNNRGIKVCLPADVASCLDEGNPPEECLELHDMGDLSDAGDAGDLNVTDGLDAFGEPELEPDLPEDVRDADAPSDIDAQNEPELVEDAAADADSGDDVADVPVCSTSFRCSSRTVERCDPETGDWSLWAVCQSSERCIDGGCQPLPSEYGQDCVVPADCPDSALSCLDRVCRIRVDGDVGDECLGAPDCLEGLLCTQPGYCQSGEAGQDCLFDDDCESTICGPSGTCQAGVEDDPCARDDDCLSPLRCAEVAGMCVDGSSGDACDGHEDCAGSAPMCSADVCRADFRAAAAGVFLMGSPGSEVGRSGDEAIHEVTLTRGLFIAEYEVTQQQWSAVMGSDPSMNAGCGSCPVERVNWYEALAYANTLSAAEGLESCYNLNDCTGTLGGGCIGDERECVGDYVCTVADFAGLDCGGFRLPTEAEWEYAARAGDGRAFYTGAVDEEFQFCETPFHLMTAAYYCAHGVSNAQPVGGLVANDFELFDMLGNVREWVWDRHASYPGGAQTDPLGPPSGSVVTRGGDYFHAAIVARAADRFPIDPDMRDGRIGIRIVRTVNAGAD